MAPTPNDFRQYNWNVASSPQAEEAIQALFALQNETIFVPPQVKLMHNDDEDSSVGRAHLFTPIHHYHEDKARVVGLLLGSFALDSGLSDALPQDSETIVATISSPNCNVTYSYQIRGPDIISTENGDAHDPHYDNYVVEIDLMDHLYHNAQRALDIPGHCHFQMVRCMSYIFLKCQTFILSTYITYLYFFLSSFRKYILRDRWKPPTDRTSPKSSPLPLDFASLLWLLLFSNMIFSSTAETKNWSISLSDPTGLFPVSSQKATPRNSCNRGLTKTETIIIRD
jgi:hypothetical protein